MAKNRSETLAVHNEVPSAHSTIPGVPKVLVWEIRHVLKRLLKPVAMFSCFNNSPPEPQNHHKNEKWCQKSWETKQKPQLTLPSHPSRHAHKWPICGGGVSVQKCLLSINWLMSWKSVSHHKSPDAFVELMVRASYSDKHGAKREPLNFV